MVGERDGHKRPLGGKHSARHAAPPWMDGGFWRQSNTAAESLLPPPYRSVTGQTISGLTQT